MALRVEHEIHTRRFGRNLGLALSLVGFVVLMLALTVVKVTRGAAPPHMMDGTPPMPEGTFIPDPNYNPATAQPNSKATP
jgi:hypothetical protein